MNAKVLVLAGTAEADEVAELLGGAGIIVIRSLACDRSEEPGSDEASGTVRTGGFGGVSGLAGYLRDEHIDLVVDATDPFAAVMPYSAFNAAAEVGVAHVRLIREPWRAQPGDRWIEVDTIDDAADVVAKGAARVFLTVGERNVAAFARCTGQWFLVRTDGPSPVELPASLTGSLVLCDGGPFRFERELELLRVHEIDTVVTTNVGGQASIAKLEAARAMGLTVVMVQRPPGPSGMLTIASPSAAAEWARARTDSTGS